MTETATQNEKKKGRMKELFSLPPSLVIVFITTLIMRASFYMSIAIFTNPNYLTHLTSIERTLVFIVYPLAELLTVSIFGVLSDKIGRKIIYYIGLAVTGFSVLMFSFSTKFWLLIIFAIILGVGAAAQVASTLAIVADEAPEDKRGRYMGFYDAMTLLGLGLGYGGGFLLLEIRYNNLIPSSVVFWNTLLNHDPKYLFIFAAVLLFIALGVAVVLLRKKVFQTALVKEESFFKKFKTVITDKNLRYLLPVWIPIICLYAIVLTKSQDLANNLNLHNISLLVVLAVIFGAILVGFPLNGILSDRVGRKPFLYVGMFSFAAFVSLLVFGASHENEKMLLYLSPALFIIGIGCGAFPPAALALLADLTKKENYGSSMGAYSVVYGMGMIIGPLAADLADGPQNEYILGVIILIWILCAISVTGTLLIPKELLGKRKAE
ncbi:MAG: MFS transporter [Candidatus Heimdallarchaeaceae archaeon]